MNGAIIWDMDGTISDTQSLHAKVESELLSRYDIHLTPDEITAKYAGRKTSEFFVELLEAKGAKGYDVNALMAEKWEIATRHLDDIKAMPGVERLIKHACRNSIPQAVASASGSRYVAHVLERLEVRGYLNAVVSGDQVSKGKPDPEIFLEAASRMGVNPLCCVVIEDGVAGMIGAKAAGMRVIAFSNDLQRDYPVDLVVNDFRQLKLYDILNVWGRKNG